MATTPTKAPARDRVLDTATRLFYAEGVHAVGIDRIIAEAGVAKASFYNGFRSKDELVRAYLEEQFGQHREAAEGLTGKTPRDRIFAFFDLMSRNGAGPSFRGCPFVNVAAEYPDADHPVRHVIAEYRAWLLGYFRDLLVDADHPDAERTAGILLLVRDGLVVGFDLDDTGPLPGRVREAVTKVLDG